MARTLGEMARRQADCYGEKSALRFAERQTSYAALYRRACQVAARLRVAEIAPADRIAYFGKNTSEFYEILLGAAMARAVLVPINWRLTDVEAGWQLADSGARLLFLDHGFIEREQALARWAPSILQAILVGGSDATLPSSYEHWREAEDVVAPEVEQDPEDIVVQLYTSGTTGNPKGAMLSHRALLAFRDLPPASQPEWNRWTDTDVGMIVMPQFHIGGTGFGLQLLCAGATGHVVREFEVGQVLDFIERYGLSKLFTVPSALQMLLDHPRVREIDYANLRTIIYGASPISPALLRQAMDVFQCDFVQQYGMTEVCGTICALDPDDHRAAVADESLLRSAGRPLRDVQIVAVDDAGRALPPGARGEIAIRTPTIMSGYWSGQAASKECFTADGFFLTGDAGYIDERGYLFLCDRVKDMIVSGGENVYPAEIEAVLAQHPAVSDVAVIGVPDPHWGEAVKAVVVLRAGMALDPQELVAWGRSRLAGYKLPKSVDFLPALPRNGVGKLMRRTLRDPHWKGQERNI